MKTTIERLHENRQIELAKSILESKGYKVVKESKELDENEQSSVDIISKIRNAGLTLAQAREEYSEEIIESIIDFYERAAKRLGVSIDKVIVTTEDDIDMRNTLEGLEDNDWFGGKVVNVTNREGYEAVAIASN